MPPTCNRVSNPTENGFRPAGKSSFPAPPRSLPKPFPAPSSKKTILTYAGCSVQSDHKNNRAFCRRPRSVPNSIPKWNWLAHPPRQPAKLSKSPHPIHIKDP